MLRAITGLICPNAPQRAIDAERQRIEDAKKKYKALTTNLKDARAHLERLLRQPRADARRRELAQQMKKLTLQRLRISRTLEGNSTALVRCHTLESLPLFTQLQAAASLQVLEITLNTRSEEQAAITKAFEDSQSHYFILRELVICGQAEAMHI